MEDQEVPSLPPPQNNNEIPPQDQAVPQVQQLQPAVLEPAPEPEPEPQNQPEPEPEPEVVPWYWWWWGHVPNDDEYEEIKYNFKHIGIITGMMIHLIYCVQNNKPLVPAAVEAIVVVPEGYVGLLWRTGFLQKPLLGPGIHVKIPLLEYSELVRVIPKTNKVSVPCSTKWGVMINFEEIKVVSQLHEEYVFETVLNHGTRYYLKWINENIQDKMNKFCNAHTFQQVYIDEFDTIQENMKEALQSDCNRHVPGIQIISVNITRPTIPDGVRLLHEQMEEERTKVLIATEHQKLALKEAETKNQLAVSEAETNATVTKIHMEQQLMEKDGLKRQQAIENEMYLAREMSMADAHLYRVTRESEANAIKRNGSQLMEVVPGTNNTFFFGVRVANMDPRIFH
ncbi:erlin-1-like [Abrus precatorius]|uniref:Erlin-1-like n=1 Tax=Abrus precatorius TaxID=3816 RepID=A0A8B8M275_ABRPR|nr:erlin-1-like [Abrus precatorius]